MSSLSKAEASRRNGALSRGPLTPEGKARSSQNAVRHGMYSKAAVLSGESAEAFDQLLASYMEEWQPATARETDLVHDIVIARWRLNRIITFETAAIDHEVDRLRSDMDVNLEDLDEPTRATLAFGSLADNSRSLALMQRYEARLLRTIQKSTELLDRLQAKRRKNNEKCENEPADMYEPAPPGRSV